MTYLIRLSQRSDGMDVAEVEWNGQTIREVSRSGVTMATARRLKLLGAPDGPWEGCGSGDGKKWLHGASVYNLAAFTISETDRGMFLQRWHPFPTKIVSQETA